MLSCDTNHTDPTVQRCEKFTLLIQDTRQSEGFQRSVVSSLFLLGVNITYLFSEITSSQLDHRIMSLLLFFYLPLIGYAKWKSISCVRLFTTPWPSPLGSSVHGILQARILEWAAISFSRDWLGFQTKGLNTGFLHCRQILHCLSHQGSPRTLEGVAYPFFRGSSQPRSWTGVSCIAGGFFSNWATREAQAMPSTT